MKGAWPKFKGCSRLTTDDNHVLLRATFHINYFFFLTTNYIPCNSLMFFPLYGTNALKVPEDRGSQISRQSSHEGGKVNLTHRPPLPLIYVKRLCLL